MSLGDPLVARVLSGTYRIETRLGAGGMGAVYAARHVRTGKAYAVKVLLPELAARTHALDRFRREAHALAALGHANIVALHDFDQTEDGLAFLVMERLDGEDLATRLRRGPLGVDTALALTDQIASALEAAHGLGMVHRDLKPANVFLARVPGAAERAVLLDFGLAKSLTSEPINALTSAGVVMGTPHYMAPEQAQGGTIDARTDLWSLGVMLHEMLSGRPPFEGSTMASLFTQILTAPPPSLRARGVVVSDALERLVARALEKDPGDRVPDATTFRRALLAISGPHASAPPTAAHAVTPETRASPAFGAQPATPMGNPFGSDRAPAPVVAAPAPSRTIWIALALFVAIASVGLGAIALAFLALPRTAPPPPAAAAPDSRPVAVAPSDAGAVSAATSDAGIPPALASAQVEASPEPPADVRSRARAVASTAPVTRRERTARPDREPPLEEQRSSDAPSSSGNPIPPGFDTSAPGAAERIAARTFISSGDWAGCVRSLRGAPPTREVLWDRASCAFQARDARELELTCAALQQRFAGSPQATGCAGMRSAMAYQ